MQVVIYSAPFYFCSCTDGSFLRSHTPLLPCRCNTQVCEVCHGDSQSHTGLHLSASPSDTKLRPFGSGRVPCGKLAERGSKESGTRFAQKVLFAPASIFFWHKRTSFLFFSQSAVSSLARNCWVSWRGAKIRENGPGGGGGGGGGGGEEGRCATLAFIKPPSRTRSRNDSLDFIRIQNR